MCKLRKSYIAGPGKRAALKNVAEHEIYDQRSCRLMSGKFGIGSDRIFTLRSTNLQSKI